MFCDCLKQPLSPYKYKPAQALTGPNEVGWKPFKHVQPFDLSLVQRYKDSVLFKMLSTPGK